MEWDRDPCEQEAQRAADRAHLRVRAAARLAAERRRDLLWSSYPEARSAAAEAFDREIARIDAEHHGWLRAQGLVLDP